MKLALVIPGHQANPHDWCIPAFTNLAHELAKSVELHVFALRYPHIRRDYSIGSVNVHAVGGGAIGGRRVVGASLFKLWRDALSAIEREHKRGGFHAVMGVWATESGWLTTVAARRLGLPSLVHLAGGELVWLSDIRYGNQRRGLARELVRRSLRNADLLTAPSGPMLRALMAHPGVLPNKVKRWSPGVDTTMFKTHERERTGPFTFVTVGSLIPVKGHSWLIEGVQGLVKAAPDTPFRLNVIGDGPLMPQLRSYVEEAKLKGYVNFVGEVQHEELPRHFERADCFLLGSRHEAQCMAALEAMACGLPWVGPPVGALADCGQGKETSGVVVKERSTKALIEAMAQALHAQPEQRNAWGDAAKRRVFNDYELAAQTSRLLALVGELTQ